MTENYFFTHEPKLNIHHEYSVFSRKTPMYVATVLQAFPIAPSPLTYYDNIAKYTHRKNVNSTIQGLYQYSRWYGSFFIYLLLKERRFSPCRFSISLSLFGFPSTVSQALLMMRSRSSCGLLCLSQ